MVSHRCAKFKTTHRGETELPAPVFVLGPRKVGRETVCLRYAKRRRLFARLGWKNAKTMPFGKGIIHTRALALGPDGWICYAKT